MIRLPIITNSGGINLVTNHCGTMTIDFISGISSLGWEMCGKLTRGWVRMWIAIGLWKSGWKFTMRSARGRNYRFFMGIEAVDNCWFWAGRASRSCKVELVSSNWSCYGSRFSNQRHQIWNFCGFLLSKFHLVLNVRKQDCWAEDWSRAFWVTLSISSGGTNTILFSSPGPQRSQQY